MEISAEIKSEKMTAVEPDEKMCVHESGVRAFRVSAAELGDPTGEDFYGLCMRVVGHVTGDDGAENTISIDLTFGEDLSRALMLQVNKQCQTLVDHKYGHMTPDAMADDLAEKLAAGLMAVFGITPEMLEEIDDQETTEEVSVPDDQKGN